MNEQEFPRHAVGELEDFIEVFYRLRMDQFTLLHSIRADDIEALYCVDVPEFSGIGVGQ